MVDELVSKGYNRCGDGCSFLTTRDVREFDATGWVRTIDVVCAIHGAKRVQFPAAALVVPRPESVW